MNPSDQPSYRHDETSTDQQLVAPDLARGTKKSILPWIIVGSLAGLVMTGFAVAALVMVGVSMGSDGTSTEPSTVMKKPDEKTSLQTYSNDAIRFAYPAFLQQEKKDDKTTIYTNGSSPTDFQQFVSTDGARSAVVEYMRFNGQSSKIAKDIRQDGISQGLTAQNNASQSALISMRSSAGLGCARDFRYTDAPKLVEKGELIGFHYGYACASYTGPITATYMVWYDEYGSKHSLTVTALEAYWSLHADTLADIQESVELL